LHSFLKDHLQHSSTKCPSSILEIYSAKRVSLQTVVVAMSEALVDADPLILSVFILRDLMSYSSFASLALSSHLYVN